jgi:hypothetical protein
MATATFAEEVKDKTREELVEACFKVHLELRILMALKTGQQVPQRLAFATEKFKQKLDNKAREEIILLYSQACEKLDNMKKAEDSEPPQQKKRKVPEAELPDSGEFCPLIVRRQLKDYLIPKAGPDVPQLTVRFDIEIEERLPPILVQCVSQAKILLEKCQNFETLKNWIKFPVFQFPQWEEHFEITWGDEGELAIYIHEVGPDCYTLGKCVAVIRKAEDPEAAASSSSSF